MAANAPGRRGIFLLLQPPCSRADLFPSHESCQVVTSFLASARTGIHGGQVPVVRKKRKTQPLRFLEGVAVACQ